MKTTRQASPNDCALIYELAVPAWEVAYSEILSDEQMEYMLDKMYSEKSIRQQMQEGHIFFILLYDNAPSGFVSFHQQSENLYILEKLYVLPHVHGVGAGRFLVEKVEEYIRNRHPAQHFLLELNVNRNNKAVGFYKRVGFHADREVNEEIGKGFVKEDYVMRKGVGE